MKFTSSLLNQFIILYELNYQPQPVFLEKETESQVTMFTEFKEISCPYVLSLILLNDNTIASHSINI